MSAQLNPASTTQELYLEILRRSRCNSLDGERIYTDLMAHRELWDAAYPVREAGGNDVTLRDLADDSHDVDCLYLRTTEERLAALSEVARRWGADEFDPEKERWGVQPKVILRLWWD